EVGPEQNEGSKGRDRPNGNLKTAARQRNCLTTPVRRKILDRLRLGATNGFVQISPDSLRRARAARGAVNAFEAKAEASVHDLKHAQVDGGILFRALELLEKTDAAHPFVEEANQHAVLRPDPAVRCRQILHDVV